MDTPKTNFTPASPPIRQPEQTDTRQGILRHDPEFERRRKSLRADQEEDDTGIILSIPALIDFLETLDRQTPRAAEEAIQEPHDLSGHTAPASAASGGPETSAPAPNYAAAQAASAYAHSAQSMQKPKVLLETTDTASDGPELDLSAADHHTIAALLKDLKILERAGIEYLPLAPAETFVQGLKNAIAAALSA